MTLVPRALTKNDRRSLVPRVQKLRAFLGSQHNGNVSPANPRLRPYFGWLKNSRFFKGPEIGRLGGLGGPGAPGAIKTLSPVGEFGFEYLLAAPAQRRGPQILEIKSQPHQGLELALETKADLQRWTRPARVRENVLGK